MEEDRARPVAGMRGWIRSHGLWLGPALVMLAAGLYRIGTPVLWRDELSSWVAADRHLGELLNILRHVDASNGAYYVVLHLWMMPAGHSPIALRLPSVLAMAAAAAFSALIAQRLFRSPVAGVAAGLLLSAVPSISRYAQEARSYAMVTCAMAAGLWLLLRALDRPSLGRWAWFGAATMAAGVFHLVSLIGLVGQLPLVLLHRGPRKVWWQYPLTVVLAAVPAIPVALFGLQQSDRQLGWVAQPSLRYLRHFWGLLFGADETPYVLPYVFLAIGALALLWPGRRLAAIKLLLLAVLPVIAVWVLSQHGTSYFLVRYLLFTVPAWAALAGGGVGALHAGLRRLAPRTPMPVAVACALAVLAVPAAVALPLVRSDHYVTAHTDIDFPGAAALVADGYRPGDALVALGGGDSWAMVGPSIVYYLPSNLRLPQPFVERSASEAEDLVAFESQTPSATVGDASRVWVVTIGTGDDPYANLRADQARILQQVFTPAEVRHVRGLTVSLLVRSHR